LGTYPIVSPSPSIDLERDRCIPSRVLTALRSPLRDLRRILQQTGGGQLSPSPPLFFSYWVPRSLLTYALPFPLRMELSRPLEPLDFSLRGTQTVPLFRPSRSGLPIATKRALIPPQLCVRLRPTFVQDILSSPSRLTEYRLFFCAPSRSFQAFPSLSPVEQRFLSDRLVLTAIALALSPLCALDLRLDRTFPNLCFADPIFFSALFSVLFRFD